MCLLLFSLRFFPHFSLRLWSLAHSSRIFVCADYELIMERVLRFLDSKFWIEGFNLKPQQKARESTNWTDELAQPAASFRRSNSVGRSPISVGQISVGRTISIVDGRIRLAKYCQLTNGERSVNRRHSMQKILKICKIWFRITPARLFRRLTRLAKYCEKHRESQASIGYRQSIGQIVSISALSLWSASKANPTESARPIGCKLYR